MVWIYVLGGALGAWALLGIVLLILNKTFIYWFYRRLHLKISQSKREDYPEDNKDLFGTELSMAHETLQRKSPWNELCFSPVYLRRLPLESAAEVRTDTVIGPHAKRPLCLRSPILIAGMGYGTAVSANTKQAIALAATKVGTAVNTGAGPSLMEERAAAEKLILQYSRGDWEVDEAWIKTADAIEIQMGQGVWGPAPVEISSDLLLKDAQARRLLGLRIGENATISTRFKGLQHRNDLEQVVKELRLKASGVPVGIKIGATHGLESELEQVLKLGIDYISIDGAEGGYGRFQNGLQEKVGIPTLFALVRARRYLEKSGYHREVSLLVGGGLKTPMDFLKAIALGADAVFIGRAALNALVKPQIKSLAPWESPWTLLEPGDPKKQLNPHLAAESLAEFLKQSVDGMKQMAVVLGKHNIRDVNMSDLSTVQSQLAEWLGIGWVGDAPPASSDETITIPLHTMTVELRKVAENGWNV